MSVTMISIIFGVCNVKKVIGMELEELSTIISDVLSVDPGAITLNSKFAEDLGADSLDVFQIVSEVEDRLQITIPEDMLEQIATVEDALNAINESI